MSKLSLADLFYHSSPTPYIWLTFLLRPRFSAARSCGLSVFPVDAEKWMFLNRDSSVGVVTGYGLKYRGLVLDGARDFSALRHDRFLTPTSFLASGYLGLISRG